MYPMTPDEDFVIDLLGGEFGEDAVVAGIFWVMVQNWPSGGPDINCSSC